MTGAKWSSVRRFAGQGGAVWYGHGVTTRTFCDWRRVAAPHARHGRCRGQGRKGAI